MGVGPLRLDQKLSYVRAGTPFILGGWALFPFGVGVGLWGRAGSGRSCGCE